MAPQRLTRRRFAGLAGATVAGGLIAGTSQAAGATPRSPAPPPRLPTGFERTFKSRFITANGIRQHAVIGGDGPPLLLIHGWPQTWFAWRLIMPALARDFTVIAVDQRGIGLTDKPKAKYDTATLANDLVALMDALGHRRFAVMGHDTGFIIGYALAADHADRVVRVALAEVPGPPGASPAPDYFVGEHVNNKLWHIAVNRLQDVNEPLIRGREDIYFGYEFAIQAGKQLPADLVAYYVGLVSNPDSLRGSLGFYRAFDVTVAQNIERGKRPLPMPVLAIGGAASFGGLVGVELQKLATTVQSVIIPDIGHWVAEEGPKETLAALTPFLAPYRAKAA